MKTKTLVTVLYLLCTLTSFSQELFHGKVIDQKTNDPLPYVNIGVVGKNIGTVSGLNGAFIISLPNSYNTDTLRFSMIGYKSRSFEVIMFKKKFSNYEKATIHLEETTTNLNEVVIVDKKWKTKILGDDNETGNNTAGFYSSKLGTELGTTIKIKKSPTYIEKFNFYIAENTYDSLFFRLNIYNIKNGRPAENILSENIFIITNIVTGKVMIDLEKYNITVQEDFFISLEYVKPLSAESGILKFGGGLFHGPSYMRYSSQGNWVKITSFGTGFNVRVMY